MELFLETIEDSDLRGQFRWVIWERFQQVQGFSAGHFDVREVAFAFKSDQNWERTVHWLERRAIELVEE
jgi:hypothetical protein